MLAKQGWTWLATSLITLCIIGIASWVVHAGFELDGGLDRAGVYQDIGGVHRSLLELFISGLKAGMLTFGGAYTVIPFLQEDAVVHGAWMTNSQFLDGLGFSGLLPAPLIIFATFVGYLGGGPLGAIMLTIGIFLPAFALTLLAHESLEKLLSKPRLREFLEGVTAGVVGLIAGTTIALMKASLVNIPNVVVFVLALAALFYFKSKLTIPLVVLGAMLVGFVFYYVTL